VLVDTRSTGLRLLASELAGDLRLNTVKSGNGFALLNCVQFADAIRAAADVDDQLLDLNEFKGAVLAAIAYHQPLTRDGLKGIFGKDISRDLIGRLRAQELITTDRRSPRTGAPYIYVTTQTFLVTFNLESLRDLPDRE